MNFGGVESVSLRLIQGLPAQDFSHLIINTAEVPGPQEESFLELPGVEVKKCPYRPGARVEFIVSCARLLRQLRPDRLLAYNFGNHAMVSLAARLACVPVSYVRVGGSPLRDRQTRRKSMILAHLARPFCRGEIAVSESVRAQLVRGLHLPARRVRTIPNGCDVEEIRRRAAVARARRAEADPLRMIMVSRMDDAKDHATLLKAVRLLGRNGRALELVLIGDGPDRKKHEGLAAELDISGEVKFLGNRTDVPEWMGRSDILIHATRSEGFPNVLIEAMAAGIPIVATQIPECREILDDGGCGMLVPPVDPEALAKSIGSLLDNPALRQKVTVAAAARVPLLYDVGLMTERYRELLSES